MIWLDWIKRRTYRPATPTPKRRRRPFVVLLLEELKPRIAPAGNINITSGLVVDQNDNPLSVVNVGESVYIQANFSTTGLPTNASYGISFTVNGLTQEGSFISSGAGDSGTESWNYYWGFFIATPGTNQVMVTVDPNPSVAATYSYNTLSFTFNAVSPSVSGVSYSAAQIRAAYGINSIPNFGSATADGTGQTIAIVDAYNDPSIITDLDGFDQAMTLTTNSTQTLFQQYGAAASILTVYNQSGTNITANIANSGRGGVPTEDPTGDWEGEETLDVEWAHAIAPGAKIDLIECNDATTLFTGLSTATDLPGVSVVSNSWSTGEFSDETADDSSILVTPAGHTGVTILASTGDGGAPAGFPSFSPNVVAVGGTELTLDNNTYAGETGWSFPTPRTLNNGSSSYSQTGAWSSQSGGYSGTYDTAAAGSSSSATWTTTISSADQGYQNATEVSATWTANPGNASEATYTIYDGSPSPGSVLGTVTVDQQNAPVGTPDGSSQFQELGVFAPTSGTLTVVLNASSANGTVVADAIGIAPDYAGAGSQSLYESEPAYQDPYQSSGNREVPDVSFDASINSGVTCYQDGSLSFGIAGTSLACPCWAGLIAIANQGRVAAGGKTLNSPANPEQTLQALYSLPASDFHDITSGYNGLSAGPGYDMVTGRGSPVANTLIPDLVSYELPPTVTGVSPNTGLSGGDTAVTITGTNFLGATAVKFGTITVTNFTVVSNTEITLTDPADPAGGTVDVTVTTPVGTSATSSADQFTYTFDKVLTATSGGGQSATVNTAFATPLVVTITDLNGNPIASVTVTFASPVSGAGVTFPDGTTAVTNADGQASIIVSANTIAGTYTVTASAAGVTGEASFTLTNTPGAAANITVFSGGSQSAVVNTAFAAPLVAEVTDEYGNAVSGATVIFAGPSSGAGVTFPGGSTATTNAQGQAILDVDANTTAGSYSVSASTSGVSDVASFSLTNVAGAPATITAVSGGSQSAVVNTAFAAPLFVEVVDEFGNFVSGATVTFVGPASGAGAAFPGGNTATTNAQGQAILNVDANTISGSYTVSASVSGLSTVASFTLTNTPGAAAIVTVVSGGSQSAVVTTAFAAPLVVEVTDQYGNALSGTTVTFASPASGAGATFPGGDTATTNANGQASVNVSANTIAGSYTVTASVSGVSTPGSFTLINEAGAPTTITPTSGDSQRTTLNTAFAAPLVATVTDAYGNPVPNVTVTFAGPASGAGVAFPDGTTAVTNAQGQASVTVSANASAGSYTVTASTSGVQTPASFALTNIGPPALVTPTTSGEATVVNTAFADPLVVTITDANGVPVPHVLVTFASPASGASAAFPDGDTATTNANGQASVDVSANTIAGTYTVTASVSGLSILASFTLTNDPGAAAAIVALSGGSQSAVANAAYAEPLVAVVTDAFGNLVPGAVVTFAGLGNGADVTFAGGNSAITNAQGQATKTVIASSSAGSYTVTASVSGVSTPASFTLTSTPGAASAIAIASGSTQSAGVNTPFAVPLVATVTDANGNVVPGVTVTFAGPGSGAGVIFPAGDTAITNANGQAIIDVNANNMIGSYTVTASVSGVAASTSFVLTNTPASGAPVSPITITNPITGTSRATTTFLTVSPSPVALGQPATLTANVTVFYNTPTGTVTFFNGTTALGPPVPLDSAGLATETISTLPVGTLNLTATYTPDAAAQALGLAASSSTTTLQVNAQMTVGAFDAATATWYLNGANAGGASTGGQFQYGAPGWIALVGDFTGDGQNTPVVVDPNTETWYIRNSDSNGGPSYTPFQFGEPGWIPIVGDWNGSGVDGIGVVNPATGTWYLRNEASAGLPDAGSFVYGASGWIPVVGNWAGNANGQDGIGMVDPTTETWYLRNTPTAGGVNYRPFVYGAPGWTPMVGAWTASGHTGIGVYDSTGTFYLRNELSAGGADAGQFAFGVGGWTPLAGQWQNPGNLAQDQLAAGIGPGAPAISNAELQSTVQEALALLHADGISPALLQSLASATYTLAELPPGVLGETFVQSNTVEISADAAGYGWYVDSTSDDPAFGADGTAAADSPAARHEDLLTTVLHEMGHLAGQADVAYATTGSNLMDTVLPLGTRRLDALDLIFASGAVD
jgi:hypothetical protein